jgi:hypothetical protein
MNLPPQVKVLARTDSLIELHTVIRDINCTSAEFMFNSSRLIRYGSFLLAIVGDLLLHGRIRCHQLLD